jgi:glutathione S-transferase
MSDEIGFDDIKLDYATIAEARAMEGLRLVLGAYTIPGPWRESCKGLFDVKGIPYVCVRCSNAGAVETNFGADGSHSELLAWTAQSSAPVAIWGNEKPRSSWIDQLNLAERLAPEPRLVPVEFDARVQMFGLINEIAGENGLGWNKRLFLIEQALRSAEPGSADNTFWCVLGEKYLYTAALGLAAKPRIIEILHKLTGALARSEARGSRYFVGATLSALDIYSACFYALLEPLPPELCPMASSYRPAYRNADPDIERAMGTKLRDHRNFIYGEHLRLPIVF